VTASGGGRLRLSPLFGVQCDNAAGGLRNRSGPASGPSRAALEVALARGFHTERRIRPRA